MPERGDRCEALTPTGRQCRVWGATGGPGESKLCAWHADEWRKGVIVEVVGGGEATRDG